MGKRKKTGWEMFATAFAREAHENNFSSRRGIWCVGGEEEGEEEVLVVYNNNFYDNYAARRDEEMGELRKKLAAEGIEELAHVTYPIGGPEDGYTYVAVFKAGHDQEPLVAEIYQAVTDESQRKMGEEG